MLIFMVIAYLFVTIGIGLWAAQRVKNTADFAIAGRNLPMYMIITTTFATWFGSEIVLGVPARAVRQGVEGADVGEAEVADGLVAFDARGDDLAGDEDELGADGEREFLAAAEEVFHAAADEGDGAAVALGEALEDAAHAPSGDAAAAVGGVDDDAAAVIVVDGQDGGDVLVRCQYICVVLLHGVASFMLNSIFLYRYYIIFIFSKISFIFSSFIFLC